MGPNTTRVRASPKQEVDRISNLPDAILCYILSFLSTKFSVRTRILSKRWKYLFTLVPVLDFFGPLDCYTSATIQPFLEFVNFVVNSYNVDRMDRFYYSSSSFLSGSDASRLFSWVQNIVNRRVKELMVLDYLEKPQTFPQNVFISESLVVLNILANFNLDVPENAYLPRVRTIHLLNVIFQCDDSVRRLFRGCPVLEDLYLDNCNSKNLEVVDICVPSLLRLKISGIKDEYALVLDVPNVRYFEYFGYESRGFSAKCGLKSLVNACVSFSASFPIWSHVGSEVLPKLISIVSHVQHLSFCSYTLEAYRGYGHMFPTFLKLTCLDMRISATLDFDLGLLVDLLDKTPHLDSLFLTSGYSSEFEPSDLVPEYVPMSVSENLKTIEFRGFSMLVYEYTLVKYFLKNAKVLHTLYVQSKGSLEQQFEITKKLLTLRRCSKACKVFVDSANE